MDGFLEALAPKPRPTRESHVTVHYHESDDSWERQCAIARDKAKPASKRKPSATWKHQQAKDMERLHPESWRELRQLVLLHGIKAIQRAIQHIESEDKCEQ